ncbi:MAG: N-6 DNA methylase [Synechococcales cyanobacterium]
MDWFGDAYEFLISNYAVNVGKLGGEFFTPLFHKVTWGTII